LVAPSGGADRIHRLSAQLEPKKTGCDGGGAERVFGVLPSLRAATDTQPKRAGQAAPGDDRLVPAFDAPNWNPGDPWQATWLMCRVAGRSQFVDVG
jgi:hypothetical protein